jgi:hypothetical protein
MALKNPSFEEAGRYPGEAAHWVLVAVCTAQEIAGFGPDPMRACEDFERWSSLRGSFDEIEVVRCFFDALRDGFEAFEIGWGNSAFLRDLLDGPVARCLFSSRPQETFELGWVATPAFNWSTLPCVVAPFSAGDRESFEAGWNGNERFHWQWEDLPSSRALFVGYQTAEFFGPSWSSATTI